MKGKIVIGILFALALAPAFVFASEGSFLTFNTTEPINIFSFCQDSYGSPCNNSVTCNMSVYYPNATILNLTSIVYNSPGWFNRSLGVLPFLGDFRYNVNCTDGTNMGADGDFFRIVSNLTFDMLQNITQIVSYINNTDAIYLPAWNATFFNWNQTYFLQWNQTLYNITMNLSFLMGQFDCGATPVTQICAYLSMAVTKQDITQAVSTIKSTIISQTGPVLDNQNYWNAFWNSWLGKIIIITASLLILGIIIWGARKMKSKPDENYEDENYG